MSAVPEFTDALVAELTTLFPDALVVDGDPTELVDDIVSVGDSTSSEEPDALAPGGRWEVIDITVTIASARGVVARVHDGTVGRLQIVVEDEVRVATDFAVAFQEESTTVKVEGLGRRGMQRPKCSQYI